MVQRDAHTAWCVCCFHFVLLVPEISTGFSFKYLSCLLGNLLDVLHFHLLLLISEKKERARAVFSVADY